MYVRVIAATALSALITVLYKWGGFRQKCSLSFCCIHPTTGYLIYAKCIHCSGNFRKFWQLGILFNSDLTWLDMPALIVYNHYNYHLHVQLGICRRNEKCERDESVFNISPPFAAWECYIMYVYIAWNLGVSVKSAVCICTYIAALLCCTWNIQICIYMKYLNEHTRR